MVRSPTTPVTCYCHCEGAVATCHRLTRFIHRATRDSSPAQDNTWNADCFRYGFCLISCGNCYQSQPLIRTRSKDADDATCACCFCVACSRNGWCMKEERMWREKEWNCKVAVALSLHNFTTLSKRCENIWTNSARPLLAQMLLHTQNWTFFSLHGPLCIPITISSLQDLCVC